MTLLLREAEAVCSLEVRGRVIATVLILRYSFERQAESAKNNKTTQWEPMVRAVAREEGGRGGHP